MGAEILDVDYNDYVTLVGTAHFTRRSLLDAYVAVERLKPTDLAIELDLERFQALNGHCASCPERFRCAGRCEFLGAADALGNVNANIWLVDMSEREIVGRIKRLVPHSRFWRFSFVGFPLRRRAEDEVELWERGFKDEVLERYGRHLKGMRVRMPHVWRVLIDERNVLMAARLAWVVSERLKRDGEVKVLALTGAAHVVGIKELLSAPPQIGAELQRLGVKFTPPTLIRRVSVN